MKNNLNYYRKRFRTTRAPKPVSIIVPVYADWESLQKCLSSLKENVASNHMITVINDCGPEVENMELKIKKAIAGHGNFLYYRNPKNLGFVKTCNRAALELDKTANDILLLNSDTQVTPGFLDTMQTALYSRRKVATVSPRSNNATVFSVPFAAATDYSYPPEKSYELYKKIVNQLPATYDTPTTHGFCMLIRRSVIKKYGLFDEIYGKGYGEESDFCRRVSAHGYVHLIANKAFVFHMGSKSFSKKQRDARVARNSKILAERYPDYDDLVMDYVRRVVYPEQTLFPE